MVFRLLFLRYSLDREKKRIKFCQKKKCLKKGQKDMTDFLQLSFYILSTSYMTTYQAKITEGVALNISKTYVCVLKKEAEH